MIDPLGMHRSIRNTRRLAEVVGVLARHGFRQILLETGISHLIDGSVASVLRSQGGEQADTDAPIEARIRMAIEELGPSFIKFGQIISTRPDLIPPELATELKKLHSDCPRVEFAKIRDRLEAELGDRLQTLFTEIEETPIAAASMAQVHRATLSDGTKVALKVLRPGIEEIIQSDMDIMMEFARLAERSFADQGYSPTEIVREFRLELEREIDLIHEGRSTDRMRRDFAEDPAVTFPRVFWEATTRRVLALEFVEGRLLSRVDPAELPAEERRALAAADVQAVFRQCLEIGFFHADPHPGNLFLLGGGRICFIDCGMTGRVDRATREQLAMLVMNFAIRRRLVRKARCAAIAGGVLRATAATPGALPRRHGISDQGAHDRPGCRAVSRSGVRFRHARPSPSGAADEGLLRRCGSSATHYARGGTLSRNDREPPG